MDRGVEEGARRELEQKDAFFKKVLDSQRAFAKVVVPYTRETSKLSTLISGAADISSRRRVRCVPEAAASGLRRIRP